MTEPSNEAVEYVENVLERGFELYDYEGVRIRFRGHSLPRIVTQAVEQNARNRWEQEVRERLQLSEALLEHLSEVMNGDLNPPDPEDDCIWCREIRQEIQRALAIFGEAEPVEDENGG